MKPTLPSRAAMRAAALALLLGPVIAAFASAAEAEVRFGSNVRIGGHDFSNRTYDRRNRAVIHLHSRQPRRPGCVWRADGKGGRVQICHLRRKSR